MTKASYAIAIGSNRPGRAGRPHAIVRAAFAALGKVTAASPIADTAPLGPSMRRYANAVAIVASDEAPDALLRRLKAIERRFGRRAGRRWGARVLDLDIVLWSEGCWASPGLIVPHPAFRERGFVLVPLMQAAPDWRDPVSRLTVRQLAARLARARPVDRARPRA
ncbi:2-amino-4-hydroxy-6-hydroxymethyldihydropteridine diphosphokinase [Sphingomonas japonica]|uniref:2-amino-4-hydroxy-6-hydroxymethyldihydropteridine pyrophosphokinase n=1 Tax=Sphingomonas japonica TaxID=511662 RepID=A0ABX0TY77_9SPHN|nr:2-amino-4-hydroxy-6-hydroxymethyldihydropteridine diphosphokinase [Sphingomonas japonica]NIJ23184.1 2-amino-4-hydroxy-6-hydroxymethyldihydropteridine diphosphokinase [Sphingomonas japonica]